MRAQSPNVLSILATVHTPPPLPSPLPSPTARPPDPPPLRTALSPILWSPPAARAGRMGACVGQRRGLEPGPSTRPGCHGAARARGGRGACCCAMRHRSESGRAVIGLERAPFDSGAAAWAGGGRNSAWYVAAGTGQWRSAGVRAFRPRAAQPQRRVHHCRVAGRAVH